jgi:signal transduction histidine kinase
VAALRQYLGQPTAEPALAFELDDGLDGEPPPEVRATLFRIAQEAVANVRKHAGATRIELSLRSTGDGVRLLVADDGRGLDALDLASPEPGHLGIPAMVERAELAGGWCRVDGARDKGTTVECWLPLQPPTEELPTGAE